MLWSNFFHCRITIDLNCSAKMRHWLKVIADWIQYRLFLVLAAVLAGVDGTLPIIASCV